MLSGPLGRVRRRLPAQLGFSLETLEYFVWMMDSPRFRQEWFLKHELHRYAKTVEPGLKVMLLGQGADEFLGTQGDVWDTQWDMFLALCGALAAQLLLGRVHDRQIARLRA